jgi:NAD(P)-dependent dehydrogenase (short-subunit alcohol dehydrogenase family)
MAILKGKSAIVTGGGRGIGKAIALKLAEEGANVIVNDIGCEVDGTGFSKDPADSTVEEINSNKGIAKSDYNNMSIMTDAENCIKNCIDSFGKLDILINSAGIINDRLILQMDESDFNNIVDNNLKSVFAPSKFAAILFRQQRSGRIVNITSDAGLGDIGKSNYAAASEGIVGLTRTTATDLGKYGITANAISPVAKTRMNSGTVSTYISSELMTNNSDDKSGIGVSDPSLEWNPSLEDGTENVASLAVCLSTDYLPNVNGYIFGVNGGSIYVYSNPTPDKKIYKAGVFSMEEMDQLVPKTFGLGY